jgi:hypothetical protein
MQVSSPIRALIVFGIVLLQRPSSSSSSFGVRADALFQLVVYSNDNAAIEDAAAPTLMDSLVSVEPDGFLPVAPGGEVPTRRRGRGRRGLVRNLQVNTCPPKCRKTTSPLCKVLGCVYCGGQSCQGRLRELFDGGELAAVEADMNDALAPFCDGGAQTAACEIGAKIVAVDNDAVGNTTVLV